MDSRTTAYAMAMHLALRFVLWCRPPSRCSATTRYAAQRTLNMTGQPGKEETQWM